jgi:hypothetical protein
VTDSGLAQAASGPLPAALAAPWFEDNAVFQRELAARGERLADLSAIRRKLESEIRIAAPAEPCPLGAIDAALVLAPLGDQLSILLQTVCIESDGSARLGQPQRITGIDGVELRLAPTAMRVAAECRELAAATTPTIADTAYWSFLMDANIAITNSANIRDLPALEEAVKYLADDGGLLGMVQNPMVVPMSKKSQSDTFLKDVSDRQVLTQVLEPGEYLSPRSLVSTTGGKFGIEQRRFKARERQLLNDLYQRHLGVLFYKPHAWSRAFRIEGHLRQLRDPGWLMPLLAAVKAATAVNRMVVEPWPQFMADYTAKRISSLAKLYGPLNWHRHSQSNYLWPRTRSSKRT